MDAAPAVSSCRAQGLCAHAVTKENYEDEQEHHHSEKYTRSASAVRVFSSLWEQGQCLPVSAYRHRAGGKQMSAGYLHLIGSTPDPRKNKRHPCGVPFILRKSNQTEQR